MMINLAIFIFCAVTASNQLFAGVPPAAGLPVIKILGTKPKPTVTPVLEATMFFPAHLAWTKNPDFRANDLFFAAMHAFEEGIKVNTDLIGVLNELEEASMKGHYKPFHLLILNDSAARRGSLYGYALLDGKSNEGLAYRAGNLRDLLAAETPLAESVAPFTGEGKEELKFLDKDFKVFFSLAEPKSGVIPPAKAPTGAGRSARAISAASNARAEASRKRFNPTEAVPNFFENLAKNCEEAIQEIGFILHSASHRIRQVEEAAGNTPFTWDGFEFFTRNNVRSYSVASENLTTFWHGFLTWTTSSLRNAQPDDYNGGRMPGNQRIDDFLALSKCETSKYLLAMTPYVTNAWTYFNGVNDFMETMAAQPVADIEQQNHIIRINAALRQFIQKLHTGTDFQGAQRQFIDEAEMLAGRKLVRKVIGAFAFVQNALATLVLIENKDIRERGSQLDHTAVEKALQKYGAALKNFARRTMMACDAQITLLENRPQLQKVFLLLKQLLLPFYQTGATPKEVLTHVTDLKKILEQPVISPEGFFSRDGRARDNIDGWLQWARGILPFVNAGLHDYLSSNINAIDGYFHGLAQQDANNLLPGIAQRPPGEILPLINSLAALGTLSGGLNEATLDEVHTGITSVLSDEVNYLLKSFYLLPAEYHAVVLRYEREGDDAFVPSITRHIALERMKLYQYITENHVTMADGELVQLKNNIQYVIDGLEDEEALTDEDIFNMNIGGEPGAEAPRGPDHPGDIPMLNAQKLGMNTAIDAMGSRSLIDITMNQRIALIRAVTPLLTREMNVIQHALLRRYGNPSQRPAPFQRRPLLH